MSKIIPCLWFDSQAEEAVKFYTSLFKRSKVKQVTRYGAEGSKASGKPKGSVMTILFELEGQKFLALNGGPHFKFTPALSLIVHCRKQKQLDALWGKLSHDEKAEQCGWLKDKYGLSWQLVPKDLQKMIKGNDDKAERVLRALVHMKKLDIAALKKAAKG